MFAGRSDPYFGAGGVALALLWALAYLGGGFRYLAIPPLLAVATAFFVFVALFFRDPRRSPGPGVVSAADGRVAVVEAEKETWRIGVFMNVTDVHVNRFPLAGEVRAVEDGGKGFRFAFDAGARHNVQRRYILATEVGDVEVIQMTGWFARRIVSYVGKGEKRAKGERLGMIRFGSRVDVLLPASRCSPTVTVGERVVAGVSQIAEVRP